MTKKLGAALTCIRLHGNRESRKSMIDVHERLKDRTKDFLPYHELLQSVNGHSRATIFYAK